MQLELADLVEDEHKTHKAESYTGLYGLHKYWGKKPYNIMATFINKYTEPNDIVLDPFCGSGVSVSEAVFNGRKAIGIDINPSSILITKQVISTIDTKKALLKYKEIEAALKAKINSLYDVVRNDATYTGENFLWENGLLKEVRFSNGSRKRLIDIANPVDIDLANHLKYEDIKTFFPKNSFFHNSRINAYRDRKVFELFTPRNLHSLSLIYEQIENIEDAELKEFFSFCFTSAIGQASKMVFVIKRRNKTKHNNEGTLSEKKEIGSWVIGYWTPKEFFENNPWTCFDSRFKKILKAKQQQEKGHKLQVQAQKFTELLTKGNFLLKNQPSQSYLKTICDNSIDYILTDPPHGNRIPYLELSMLWNSWLKKEVNYEDEIIVSESKDRNKDIKQYNHLMFEVFEQCFRVLKPLGRISFMFNGLDDKSWLHSIEMFNKLGFQLEQIESVAYSANSVVQDNRKNGLQTDFIITYQKPDILPPYIPLEIIEVKEDSDIVKNINYLKSKGLKPFTIMNNVMSQLLLNHKFLKVTDLITVINNA